MSNTVAAADVTVTDGYIFLSIPKASETVGNTKLNKESQLGFHAEWQCSMDL